MRVPALVSEFFDWRWAPCVGLTAGSLGFVALALLLIPTHFDGSPALDSSPNEAALLDRATTAGTARALLGASLPGDALASIGRSSAAMAPAPRAERVESAPPVSQPAAIVQRGFSPIIDRPEPPPPAPPPPAPVEVAPPPTPPPAAPSVAPPPDPAPVVVQQPDADAPHRE